MVERNREWTVQSFPPYPPASGGRSGRNFSRAAYQGDTVLFGDVLGYERNLSEVERDSILGGVWAPHRRWHADGASQTVEGGQRVPGGLQRDVCTHISGRVTGRCPWSRRRSRSSRTMVSEPHRFWRRRAKRYALVYSLIESAMLPEDAPRERSRSRAIAGGACGGNRGRPRKLRGRTSTDMWVVRVRTDNDRPLSRDQPQYPSTCFPRYVSRADRPDLQEHGSSLLSQLVTASR